MSAAFVPLFTELLEGSRLREAAQVTRVLATILFVVMSLVVLLGVLLAPVWIRFFAPGFAAEPAKLALTVHLAQLLLPYALLVSLTALLASLLNALRRFAVPALSPMVLNVSMISVAILLAPRLATPIYALAWGVLVGGLLQLGMQALALRPHELHLSVEWKPRHPAVRRVLTRMIPVVFGSAVYQINLLVSTILASTLPTGSVSYLWYADRVFEFPLGIFAVALGTAALPSLSAQANRRAYGEMRRSLDFAMRVSSFIAVPAAVGLFVLATPITTVLFRRGAFGAQEVEMTAFALRALTVGLWSVSLVRILIAAFYALGDTRSPVYTASVAFAANLLFSLMFMGPVADPEGSSVIGLIASLTAQLGIVDLRHAGLSLATSLAATVNLLLLGILLMRRLGRIEIRSLGVSMSRSMIAALVMGLVVHRVAAAIDWNTAGQVAAKAACLGAAIGCGGVVYGLVSWIFGAPEIATVRAAIRQQRVGSA
jgi:putative peptidoglycan lipid II flippase